MHQKEREDLHHTNMAGMRELAVYESGVMTQHVSARKSARGQCHRCMSLRELAAQASGSVEQRRTPLNACHFGICTASGDSHAQTQTTHRVPACPANKPKPVPHIGD